MEDGRVKHGEVFNADAHCYLVVHDPVEDRGNNRENNNLGELHIANFNDQEPRSASASFYTPLARWRMSDRNSLRVSCSSRKQPSIDDVTASECCFSTPRIIMHR